MLSRSRRLLSASLATRLISGPLWTFQLFPKCACEVETNVLGVPDDFVSLLEVLVAIDCDAVKANLVILEFQTEVLIDLIIVIIIIVDIVIVIVRWRNWPHVVGVYVQQGARESDCDGLGLAKKAIKVAFDMLQGLHGAVDHQGAIVSTL